MASDLQQPTQILSRFQQDFNDLFRPFSEPPCGFSADDKSAITGEWIPPVNIHEAGSQFFISINTPRMDAKDVELSIENGILSIKAERKLHRNEYRNGYYRNDCGQENFYRRVSLPESADPAKISTKFRDGVLTITLGKR